MMVSVVIGPEEDEETITTVLSINIINIYRYEDSGIFHGTFRIYTMSTTQLVVV